MIFNYIKFAFRNFKKQRSYTMLNIVGLSVGLTASLLIFQYVKYERSFDRFHSKAEDIYRIQYNGYLNTGLNFESALSVPVVGPALRHNFPEVEEFTRVFPFAALMDYDDPARGRSSTNETRLLFVEPTFLKIFDFNVIAGNPQTALDGERKTIISKTTAQRYFGNENPIGKRVTFNREADFEVTAVVDDAPENSHLKFTWLLSYSSLKNLDTEGNYEDSWTNYNFYTYVLLRQGSDVQKLQEQWNSYVTKQRLPDWTKTNSRQEFILQPLTNIHLYSKLLYEAEPNEIRDGDSIYALGAIAVLIIIIAWVNYVNLATARSFKRANEVGVRRVAGATRRQLITQFFTECVLINLSAMALAVAGVALLWKPFSTLTGWNIPFDVFTNGNFLLMLLGLLVAAVFFSGFYPAFILSSFKPVVVLKGKSTSNASGTFLRKSLVMFQFAASISLTLASIVVYKQMTFMKNKDIGVDISQTLVLKGPYRTEGYRTHWNSFKSEVLRIPGVQSIVSGSSVPGEEITWTEDLTRVDVSGARVMASIISIDHEYLKAFKTSIVAGSHFTFAQENTRRVIINETLSEMLGFQNADDAIGEQVLWRGDTTEIIGVAADFHQQSVRIPVTPIAFLPYEASGYYAIKMESSNYHDVIKALENPWKASFEEYPLEYFFLDQFFNRQYDKDNRLQVVMSLFTGLTIAVAGLGLFGLASFVATQRTKEIGIRKVLGASVASVVALLTKGFIHPVLIATAVAWPIAGWAMNEWLQEFPYRTNIGIDAFAYSGIGVLLIALLSVSTQTLRAGMIEPAKTLKYE